MSKKYTFRELIESQLSGVIWQKFDYILDNQWDDMNCVGLIELERLDEIVDPNIYRIKPKVRTVRYCNGIELPQCVTEPLEKGAVYYHPYLLGVTMGYFRSCWAGTVGDSLLLKKGMIYLDEIDAQTHYDAIMNIEIKEIEE